MEKYCKSEKQCLISSADVVREALRDRLKARVWLISDLQQSQPEKARRSLYTALEDFYALNLKCDKIWYLGDSVEGKNMAHLDEMTLMQEEAFVRLALPLCYVMGNHDMEVMPSGGRVPFYDMIKTHPNWKCVEKCSDFYYFDTIADLSVLFISDCFAPDFSWWTCHGRVFGDEKKYPYGRKDIEELKEKVKSSGRKTITVSHYAYPGGNRESGFMAKLLPLPENVIMHIYGHAHIGDAVWAGRNCMRKISWTDNSDIPQADIASLERDRGNAVRSAFLEIYDDFILISFRNHDKKIWTESFAKEYINC